MKSKRILVLLLAAALCLLAGCGRGGETSETSETSETNKTGAASGKAQKTFLAHVKIDWAADTGTGPLALLIDDVEMVTGDDLDDNYTLVNETEDWVPYTATERTAFSVQYDLTRMELDQRAVGLQEFRQYLCLLPDGNDQGPVVILANVTAQGGRALKVEEVYVP